MSYELNKVARELSRDRSNALEVMAQALVAEHGSDAATRFELVEKRVSIPSQTVCYYFREIPDRDGTKVKETFAEAHLDRDRIARKFIDFLNEMSRIREALHRGIDDQKQFTESVRTVDAMRAAQDKWEPTLEEIEAGLRFNQHKGEA